jgi:hypothetical protein
VNGNNDRGRWVEQRFNELPKYCIFFYNLLLDSKLPDEYKIHVFGTLGYILEGGDIIPKSDPLLGGLDEVAFSFRCMSELIGRLPQAMLAVYEEVLHREGINLRELVRQAPANLDKFFFALGGMYKERITKRAPYYKNAIKTGELVRGLQTFLQEFKPARWTSEHHAHVAAFLESFGAPARK